MTDKDYVYDEVMDLINTMHDEYNLDWIKNRPRSAVVGEVLKLHGDLIKMRDLFFKYVEATG